MFIKRLGIGTAISAALLIVAVALPAGAAGSSAQAGMQKALNARSDALDREYGLGKYSRTAVHASTPGWLLGLKLRSDALNRRYGLGENARTPAGEVTPGWLRALLARSDALNRMYGLGRYAKTP